ncbi:MAG: hypothetical protein G01um101419_746 [Parcubacteria group bacterium Gr01-1014_19]|nr:MAG: hypothetical protein G01um101419_746 [Parcubacteria group bacterium Gr01-1014_19]
MDQSIAERRQKVLYDEKWIKFLRRAWLFRHIPFVDFAVAAGSMATGQVNTLSDFDVIVGARSGRIFSARLFAILAFGFFGWRRSKLNHKESASDKICLNHFVTEKSYRLSGPHDKYWQSLYKNLVPIFGTTPKVQKFFAANQDWAGGLGAREDLRWRWGAPSWPKLIVDGLLSGFFGDQVERFLRRLQLRRIERGLKNDPPGYKPRIIYGDDELEFHPDTRRIEALNEKL